MGQVVERRSGIRSVARERGQVVRAGQDVHRIDLDRAEPRRGRPHVRSRSARAGLRDRSPMTGGRAGAPRPQDNVGAPRAALIGGTGRLRTPCPVRMEP